MRWRKLNNILHRDIGYLVVAMTLIYGVSGVAVNHVADWNPSYAQRKETLAVPPIAAREREAMVAEAMKKLSLTEMPENSFRPDSLTLQLFYDGESYMIDLPTGHVIREAAVARPVLFEVNQLHLNAPKRWWTYVADLYAVALIVVAVTGLFVLKGRKGITGRGAWLTLIGLLVPVLYWLYYLYWQ